MLSSFSHTTFASKNKVFSPELDSYVDDKIDNVNLKYKKKKELEKNNFDLKCSLSKVNEEITI